MGFIRRLKSKFLPLCLAIGILSAAAFSFIPSLRAENSGLSSALDENSLIPSPIQLSDDPNNVTKNAADPNNPAAPAVSIVTQIAAVQSPADPNKLAERLNENVKDSNAILVSAASPGTQALSAIQPMDDPNENVVDPNVPAEEDEDDFSPRFSTYVEITELFEEIFTSELITENGLVDYSTLRRKRLDIIRAADKLEDLSPAVLMALSQNDKQAHEAFCINTFNLCMLKLVIDHYPIEPKLYMIFYPDNSIMQISGNWRTKYFFDIQGLEYNLEEIEQDFLIDRHKDPRIIFALSYASLGGATLRNEAYTAEKLDQQLDDQVRKYLQTPQGMKIDRENNVLYLSNIFSMHNHRELFLNSEYADIKKFRDRPADEQAWLNFIWKYLSEEDRQYLETASPHIRFMKYDWELNESP